MKALSKQAERVFRAAMARVAEQKAAGQDDHWRIGKQGGAIMPLCVEHIGAARFKTGPAMPLYSFAHYYQQNGDAMRDPDVVMLDAPGGLYPISYRQDGVGIDQEALEYDDAGVIVGIRPKMQADITAFCGMWAKNLKDQQGL